MSDISNKILNILRENDISDEEIHDVLFRIQEEIDEMLWEKITISPTVFYKLRDTIFFNFEHLTYVNDVTGKSNLKYFGCKYPVLMLGISSNNYIKKEYIETLLSELNDIKSKWNDQIYVAELYSKHDFNWVIGDKNPTDVIFYNKDNETPATHGYYNNSSSYGNIVDANGLTIKRNQNVILCAINKLDLYREYNVLTQTLDNLYNSINNANINGKGIILDFENFDYKH